MTAEGEAVQRGQVQVKPQRERRKDCLSEWVRPSSESSICLVAGIVTEGREVRGWWVVVENSQLMESSSPALMSRMAMAVIVNVSFENRVYTLSWSVPEHRNHLGTLTSGYKRDSSSTNKS